VSHLIQELGLPGLVALGAPPTGAPNFWVQLIPFALVLGIFYFIIILPMKRRQQKVAEFHESLKVGDRVVTSGGIFCTVTKLSEKSVQVEIAERVRINVARTAIVGYEGKEPVASEGQS
jgi:preprotein translocase subunit YajC